jgi:hypothetical protein
MKKIILLSLAAAALASCKKEDAKKATITYNIAFGGWSTQPSNFTVTYVINGDSTVATSSSNYRDEVYGLEDGDPYTLRVDNNIGTGTIGADVFIQKCLDGNCGDFYPVSQKHSTSSSITTVGNVEDPEQ